MSYASEKRWENLWYFPTDLMKLYRKVPTNPAKVKAVQDRKVRELMKIAYDIPFYRERFEATGTTPEDYTCAEDLYKFPVLTKEELRDWSNLELDEHPEKYKDWHISPTSGSTGVPLRTPFSPKENAWNKANFMRSIMLAGFKPGIHKCLHRPNSLHTVTGGKKSWTQQLIDTAKAHHVVYLEAMRLVFDDALPIIRDALPEIGTLRRVTAEFTQYSSRYDRVRAGEPHINAFDPALCNAAILDMGCYPIHALVSMFGAPAHVSAEAYHLESGFEAGGIALLRYPGFVCEAIWSKVCRQASPTTFMGEDGSILLDDINHIRRIWLVRRNGEIVELPYREKLPNNMMYELREFAGYIASGTQPEKRNRDSVITASVIEQARRQTGTLFDGE